MVCTGYDGQWGAQLAPELCSESSLTRCARGPVPVQVLADELGVTLMHTSARTSEGVEAAFLTLAAQVLGRCVCVVHPANVRGLRRREAAR